MHIKSKAAILWRLAFSLTLLLVIVACEDPSSVGGEYVEKNKVVVDTILVDNLVASAADPYLGRLSSSPAGDFSDPLFGDISTFSFLKVPIETFLADSVTLSDTTAIELNLRFLRAVYGDSTTTNSYRIVRVSEQWRGATYRQSNTLAYDENEVAASFTDADVDTTGLLTVELGGSWKQDYITYFNSDADNSVELYEQNEFGLAIIPDAGSQKIRYISFANSSLEIQAPLDLSLEISDWGFDMTEVRGAPPSNRVILSNRFNEYYTFNLQEYADQLPSQNIVKAELIFTPDTTSMNNSLQGTEVRTPASQMGMSVGSVDDVAYELGFSASDITGFFIEGDYVFDITPALNNYFFSSADISEIYINLISSQGYLSYSQQFGMSANPDLAPKMVIYSLEEE